MKITRDRVDREALARDIPREVLARVCEKCGAEEGEPCRIPSGRLHKREDGETFLAHAVRRRAAFGVRGPYLKARKPTERAALLVRCETCGVEPGEVCRTSDDVRSFESHRPRVEAAVASLLPTQEAA